jgi:hypothetical protein
VPDLENASNVRSSRNARVVGLIGQQSFRRRFAVRRMPIRCPAPAGSCRGEVELAITEKREAALAEPFEKRDRLRTLVDNGGGAVFSDS